jgi:hypothetical protein
MRIELSGLSAGATTVNNITQSRFFSRIDIGVDVERRSCDVSIKAKLSDVTCLLDYNDYLGLLRVARRNLGQEIDRTKWDNLEAAWEKEAFGDSSQEDVVDHSRVVSYSTSARHVRFGREKQPTDSTSPVALSLGIVCRAISLTLQCNDELRMVHRGIILIRAMGLEVAVARSLDTGLTFSTALQCLYVFDLHRSVTTPDNTPDFPRAIVAGYTHHPDDTSSAQVIVRIERPKPGSEETNVSIVINYLSLTALLQPLEHAIAFGTCRWGKNGDKQEIGSVDHLLGEQVEESTTRKSMYLSTITRLKLVLHHPRFIFPAEEEELNSRALVLQG